MANEFLATLFLLTLVSLAATALVLILRLPLRKLFGPAQAYAVWCLVPLAMCAALLPARSLPHAIFLEVPAAAPLHSLQGQIAAAPHADWQLAACVVWLAGTILSAQWFCRQHRRFMHRLGRLTARNGLYYAHFDGIGPALVGIWRPRIVVPANFDTCYGEVEKALIVAHERAHIRRGDVAANLLCALLQCLFWFNPLLLAAVRCFRFDQELSCDAAVMRQHPASRRTYADAMLKTHLAEFGTPIACHWQASHPLKERIMHLNATTPHVLRRVSGAILIGCLLLAGSYGAWATQASAAHEQSDSYRLTLNISSKQGAMGETETSIYAPAMVVEDSKPVIVLKAGETAEIMQRDGGIRMNYSLTVTPVKDDTVELGIVAKRNGTIFSKPTILLHLGEPGELHVGPGSNGEPGYRMNFSVAKVVPKKAQ